MISLLCNIIPPLLLPSKGGTINADLPLALKKISFIAKGYSDTLKAVAILGQNERPAVEKKPLQGVFKKSRVYGCVHGLEGKS